MTNNTRENLFSKLFQLLEATLIPWFPSPFIFKDIHDRSHPSHISFSNFSGHCCIFSSHGIQGRILIVMICMFKSDGSQKRNILNNPRESPCLKDLNLIHIWKVPLPCSNISRGSLVIFRWGEEGAIFLPTGISSQNLLLLMSFLTYIYQCISQVLCSLLPLPLSYIFFD